MILTTYILSLAPALLYLQYKNTSKICIMLLYLTYFFERQLIGNYGEKSILSLQGESYLYHHGNICKALAISQFITFITR